jgi:hypothetical protein
MDRNVVRGFRPNASSFAQQINGTPDSPDATTTYCPNERES